MIETMCVVCHGPVRRTQQPVTSIVCQDDGGCCRGMWRRMQRRGCRLPWKFEQKRLLHAYRRELQAVEARLAELLHAGGWLEVG